MATQSPSPRPLLRCAILAAFWAFSAAAKIVWPANEPASFIPGLDAEPTLLIAAVIEAFVALALVTKYWIAGLWATLALTVLFGALLSFAELSSDIASTCGCFGRLVHLDATKHVMVLAGVLFIAASVALDQPAARSHTAHRSLK